MTDLEKEFKKHLEEKYNDNLFEFMEEMEDLKPPFPIEADLDKINYDSYGYEDSYLGKVIKFKEGLILIDGARQSYNGELWNGFKEVQPVTKTFITYE